MAHGFFLNMGGFMRVSTDIHTLKEPENPGRDASGIMKAAYTVQQNDYEKRCRCCDLGILTLENFKELIEDPNYEFPRIPTTEIRDRSKGDALSKCIAILQTTWFLLQCIARGYQRLALTEVELITLALASLNAITYAFWWHKPLWVQEPMRMYFKVQPPTEEQRSDVSSEASEITAYYVISKVGKSLKEYTIGLFDDDCCGVLFALPIIIPIALFFMLCLCALLPFPLGIIFLLKILKTIPVTEEPSARRGLIAAQIVLAFHKVLYGLTSYIAGVSEGWLRELFRYDDALSHSGFFVGWLFILPTLFLFLLMTTVVLLPLFTLLFLVSFIFTAAFGVTTSNAVAPGATHVPSFYAPSTKSDKYSRMVVFAFFGVIFGGLHCIGWIFTYPTTSERNLWRASSLAITAIPFIVAPIDYILESFELNKGFGRVVRLVLDLVMTILLFIYVPARLSLIAQALALLRNQPQTAFLAIDWTTYIPHIF